MQVNGGTLRPVGKRVHGVPRTGISNSRRRLPLMSMALRLALPLLLACAVQAHAAPRLLEMNIGRQRIAAEIADTPEKRAQGLMHRSAMPERRGMLFVHDDSRMICMWMKDTPIPLSVAFIDAEGRILNIEDMRPDTLDLHCASGPARYALEMRLGWFRDNGVTSGVKVSGLERLPGHKNR